MKFIAYALKISRNTLTLYFSSRSSYLAGSIAYFMLLSVIPVLLISISIIGAVFGQDAVNTSNLTERILSEIPAMDARFQQMFASSVNMTLDFAYRNWTALGLVGILGIIWTSKNITFSLGNAMDTVLQVPRRKNIALRLVDSFSVVITIVLLISISMFLNMMISAVSFIEFPFLEEYVRVFFSRFIPLLVTFITSFALYYVLYRILSGSKTVRPQWAMAGALLGALLWEAVKGFGGYYLAHGTEKYKMVYGSLAVFVYTTLWAYLFGLTFIAGVCFIKALKMEFEYPRDSSPDADKPENRSR